MQELGHGGPDWTVRQQEQVKKQTVETAQTPETTPPPSPTVKRDETARGAKIAGQAAFGAIKGLASDITKVVLKGASETRAEIKATKSLPGKVAHAGAGAAKAVWKFVMTTDKYFKLGAGENKEFDPIIRDLQKATDNQLQRGADGKNQKLTLTYEGKKLGFNDLKKLAQEQAANHTKEAKKLDAEAETIKEQVGEDHPEYLSKKAAAEEAKSKANAALKAGSKLVDAEQKRGTFGEHVAKGKLAGRMTFSGLAKVTGAHWLLTSKRTFKLPDNVAGPSQTNGAKYTHLCQKLQAALPDSHVEVNVHEGTVLVKVDGHEKSLVELQGMMAKQAHRAETLPTAQTDAMSWIGKLDAKAHESELSTKLQVSHIVQAFFKEPRIVVSLNRDTDTAWWQVNDTRKRSVARAGHIQYLAKNLFGEHAEVGIKGSTVTVGLKAEAGGKADKLTLQQLRESTNQKVLDLKNHLEFGENLTAEKKTVLKDRIEMGEKLTKFIGAETPAQKAEVRAHRNILRRAAYNMTYALYVPTIIGMRALAGMRGQWRDHKYNKEIDRKCGIVVATMRHEKLAAAGESLTPEQAGEKQKVMSTHLREAMKTGFELQHLLEKQQGKQHEVGKVEGQYKAFIAKRESVITDGKASPEEKAIAKEEIAAFKEALKFENRALRNAMFHAHPDTIKFLIKEGLFRNVAPGDVLFNSETPALLFALEHRTFGTDKAKDKDDKVLSSKIKEEIKVALFQACPDAASREVIVQNLYNNGQADLAERLVLELYRGNNPKLSTPPTSAQVSAHQLAMTLGSPQLMKEVFGINPGDSQAVIQKKVAPFLLMPDSAGRTLLDFAPVGQNMTVRLALRQALIEKYNSPPDSKSYKEARADALETAIKVHARRPFPTAAEREASLNKLIGDFPELGYLKDMEVSMRPTVFGGLATESKRSRKVMLGHLQRELSNIKGDPLTTRDVTGKRPLRSITIDMAIEGNELLTKDRVNLHLATLLKNEKLRTVTTDAGAFTKLNELAQTELKGEELKLFDERFNALVNKHSAQDDKTKGLDNRTGLLREAVTIEEYRSLVELLPQDKAAEAVGKVTGKPIDLAALKKASAVKDFTMASAYYHVLESPRIGFITSCVVAGKFTGCMMAVIGMGLLSPKASFFMVQFVFQGSICSNIAAGAYIGGTRNRAFWGKLMAGMKGYNRDMPNLKALHPVDGSAGNLEVKRPPGTLVRELKAMGYEKTEIDEMKLGNKLGLAKELVAKGLKKTELEGRKLLSLEENSTEIVHHLAYNDAEAAINFINNLKSGEEKNVNWDHVISNLHKMVHYESQDQRMELVGLLFEKLQTSEQLDDLIEIQNNMGLKPIFTEKFLDKKINELYNIERLPAAGTADRKQLDMQYAALLLACTKGGSLERYRQLKAIKPLFESCDLIQVGGARNSLLHSALLSKLNNTNKESIALGKEVYKDMTAYAQKHYPHLDVLKLRRGGSAWYTRWHASVRIQDKISLEKAELFDEALGIDTAASGSLTSAVMRRLIRHTLSLASEFIMVLPCKLMLNVAAGSKAEVLAENFAHAVHTVCPFIPKVLAKTCAVFLIETCVLVSGFASGIVLGKGITGSLQHAREKLDEYTQVSAYGNTPTERMEHARMHSSLEDRGAAQMSIGLLRESIQEVINEKTKANPGDSDIGPLTEINNRLETLKNSNKEGKNMIMGIKYVILSVQAENEGKPPLSLPALANVHENLLANLEDPVKFGESMQKARGEVHAAAKADVDPLDPTTNPHVRLAENFVKLRDTLDCIYTIPNPKGGGSFFEGTLNLITFPFTHPDNAKLHDIMEQRTFESPYELGQMANKAYDVVETAVLWMQANKIDPEKSPTYKNLIDLGRELRKTRDEIITDARAARKDKVTQA